MSTNSAMLPAIGPPPARDATAPTLDRRIPAPSGKTAGRATACHVRRSRVRQEGIGNCAAGKTSAGPALKRDRMQRARPILARPVLREPRAELATAREAGGGEGLETLIRRSEFGVRSSTFACPAKKPERRTPNVECRMSNVEQKKTLTRHGTLSFMAAADPSHVSPPIPVLIVLLLTVGAASAMFIVLVWRATSHRRWVALGEWARERGFRF